MVSLERSGVTVYGELDKPTRTTGLTVTELPRYPEGERHYSWPEDYLAWLEGKEEHQVYYAWLRQTAPWWGQSIPAGAGAIWDLDLTYPGHALAIQDAADPERHRTCHNPSTAPVLISKIETMIKVASQ